MRVNELRLWFASMAYVPLCVLRRLALQQSPIRQSHLRHNPPRAVEDRRTGAHQCAPHHLRDGLGLPLSARLTGLTGRRWPRAALKPPGCFRRSGVAARLAGRRRRGRARCRPFDIAQPRNRAAGRIGDVEAGRVAVVDTNVIGAPGNVARSSGRPYDWCLAEVGPEGLIA